MSLLFKARSPEDLDHIADTIINNLHQPVVAFYGAMGVGKTTLIKCICLHLGVEETQTNSPSFSLVNEYSSKKGPIYHFDFYRIKNLQEVYDMGYEDYFYSKNTCLIEWPEKVACLLPERHHSVQLIQKEEERVINFM